MGITSEYEHRFEKDLDIVCDKHDAMQPYWKLRECEATKTTPFQVTVPLVKPVKGEVSDEMFFGIEASCHMVVGGHFTVGWDAKEFLKQMSDN